MMKIWLKTERPCHVTPCQQRRSLSVLNISAKTVSRLSHATLQERNQQATLILCADMDKMASKTKRFIKQKRGRQIGKCVRWTSSSAKTKLGWEGYNDLYNLKVHILKA